MRTLKTLRYGRAWSWAPCRNLPPPHLCLSSFINVLYCLFGFSIALLCFNQISSKLMLGEENLSRGLSPRPSPPPSLWACQAGTLSSVSQDCCGTRRYKPRRAMSSVTREQLLSLSTWRDVESFRVSRSSFRLPPTHLFQERLNTSKAERWMEASAKMTRIATRIATI